DSTLEKLGQLRPIHGPGGVITAGNSSSLNDGAAVVVLVSEDYANKHGLNPRARVVAGANAGVSPAIMGIGPVPATRKVLARTGWSVDDLAAVELNEAFASQTLACIGDLGLDPDAGSGFGGALALGDPLGCSGTRTTLTLLSRRGQAEARKGLATLCVGVGQGSALLLERASARAMVSRREAEKVRTAARVPRRTRVPPRRGRARRRRVSSEPPRTATSHG